MKTLRKRLIMYGIIGLIAAGCGAKPEATAQLAEKNITLTAVTPFAEGDGSHEAYRTLCEEYTQKYGVTVDDRSSVSNEQWKTGIIQSFADGTEPDVLFFFASEDAEPFTMQDKVVSVEEIRTLYPDYAAAIAPGTINALRAANQEAYAIPVSGYWEGLFVNLDVFEAHQVDIPQTWDEFLTAVKRFKAAGILPVAVSLRDIPHYWFEFLIYNYTGPSAHMKTIPEPQNLHLDLWGKGLSDFTSLYQMGAFPPVASGLTDQDTFVLFERKEAAMLIDGSWKVGSIKDTEKVAVIFFPSPSSARQRTDIIGGFSMGFYITRKAWDDENKREAAVQFVQTMTSAEGVSRFCASGAAQPISGLPAQSGSPLLASVAEMSTGATAYTPAVQDSLKQEAREYLFGQIPAIAAGEAEVSEVLAQFAELNSR